MDVGFTINRENPLKSTNILSKLFFGWMIKLCYKGTKKNLEVSDLYKILPVDQSEKLTNDLERNWEIEVTKAKLKNDCRPSLLKAIIKTFIWKYMLFGVLLFIQMIVLRSFQPVVLAYFINLFSSDKENPITEMYISGSIIVLQSVFIMFFTHHVELGQSSIGMRIRIAISSLVYRKMLKLNSKSLEQTAAGQVVNLLSNDVQRFDVVTIALHYIWIMPFQVLLVTYLIWREVGISSLAGVLSMALLTLPVQSYLGKLTSRLRLQVAQRTDHRVKLMSEVIAGIQVIKMYAWEKPFEKIVKYARRKEINSLTKASYLRGIYMSCMVFIERTTLFLTVVCYVLLGNNVSADKVFSMAQFYNILQLAMAILYPMAITFGAEALVSIKRLQEFLVMEEKLESTVDKIEQKEINLKEVNASWTEEVETIRDLNLHIRQGDLCAIVGPVGAGKSSILQLLLGELPATSGIVQVGGTISYSSQEPWLFASTVRNNILFGQEYNKLLYRQVVKVCALEKDFQQFPQGDKTMVGERGVSLSGGQRARINLARAVYRQTDIYLFDDPLSAVDTHVGKHLFEECMIKFLKNKTRVLVTHQLQHLKKADIIVVLSEGKIEAQGTFEQLTHTKLDFTKLLVASDETVVEKEPAFKVSVEERKGSILSSMSLKSEASTVYDTIENDEELATSNGVPFRDYVKAAGNCCSIFGLFTVFLLGQTACSGADYWVAFWTQQESIRSLNKTVQLKFVPIGKDTPTNELYHQYWYDDVTEEVILGNEIHHLVKTDVSMYIYTGLIVAAIFTTVLRSFLYYKMAMTASKNLHNKMFTSLLKAPMRFFDLNPSGRVLNRFSKDMGAIDEILPRFLLDAVQIILVMCGILVMVTVSNYYMVVAIVIFGIIFLKVRAWYVSTAKDVKHLEGVTKSPVFSHLSSSLNGITTIRACQAEELLRKEFDNHQDAHTSAHYLTIATRVSFGLWMDTICVLFVAVIIYIFVVLSEYGQLSGSVVGLAISQALILTGMLQYGMTQTAQVINQLTSVERVMQYTNLEHEDKLEGTETKPPSLTWPDKGLIEFIDLSLRYSESDPAVLRHLNFFIAPGHKVGIVGRTGAGKSSLISALFRLATLEGTIVIDGIDTKNIKLGDLRKKISIIPQEPVLFSATLRYNLDPFQEFGDDKLWNALAEVELKDAISSLDFIVSEGGGNFSLGQRQLICLARAILRNNKILVLDEATANVDPKTDSLIQATIRRKFRNCTVLTIAHRLNTIMDSDKVLVMDAGRMVEYDHPHMLLQDSEGHFSKMVSETGPTMTQQLKQISQNVYLSSIQE